MEEIGCPKIDIVCVWNSITLVCMDEKQSLVGKILKEGIGGMMCHHLRNIAIDIKRFLITDMATRGQNVRIYKVL